MKYDSHTLLETVTREIYARTGRVHYLEIGVQEGNSAFAVLNTGLINFAVLIDPWGLEYGGTGKGSPDHVIKLLGDLSDKVVFITGKSENILPTLHHLFDLIFIDGDHSEAGCLSDLRHSLMLLRPGGIIVIDDTVHPQHAYLKKAVETFCTISNLAVEFYDHIHAGMAVIRT